MKTIPVEDFGKDHWSLLAYIKTRCVDYGGVLDIQHMRTKNGALSGQKSGSSMGWKPEYGTRLKGFWNKDGTTNQDRMILDHDDHDCQEDLEAAGYIKNKGTGLNPAVKMTRRGFKIVNLLEQHKAAGGNFADFTVPKRKLL